MRVPEFAVDQVLEQLEQRARGSAVLLAVPASQVAAAPRKTLPHQRGVLPRQLQRPLLALAEPVVLAVEPHLDEPDVPLALVPQQPFEVPWQKGPERLEARPPPLEQDRERVREPVQRLLKQVHSEAKGLQEEATTKRHVEKPETRIAA